MTNEELEELGGDLAKELFEILTARKLNFSSYDAATLFVSMWAGFILPNVLSPQEKKEKYRELINVIRQSVSLTFDSMEQI